MRVSAVVAVVPQHKILIRRDNRAGIFIIRRLFNVRFIQRKNTAVRFYYFDRAVRYFNLFTGEADNPFGQWGSNIKRRIRGMEYDDIAALRGSEL